MPTQWHKIREVFDAALQQPPEARSGYINLACAGDDALRAEVVALFSSLDQADGFLQQPAVATVADFIAPAPGQLAAGMHLGHYEILRPLGSGGMGEVYLAQDNRLDRQVAVKILNDKYNQDAGNLARFTREAKATSALNHPNILVIHEIGASDETHYIVSEYVKGQTLRGILTEQTLPLTEVLDIASQVANALAAAHEVRLVHRDIKPENVMLRPDGLVKVLDFGLAKLVEQKNKSLLGLGDSTAQQSQTAKGMILGTVNYMSSEQAKGERVDERTDIFSFGVLLYEMLAGQTPFAGNSVLETLANVINAEPPPLARFVRNVPDELQRLVAKTLCKDRDARYQTMKGLLADLKELRGNLAAEAQLERGPATANPHATTVLQEAVTGDERQTTAATQGSSISLIIKEHKPFAAVALAALLVALLGVGYYFFFSRQAGVNAGGKKSIAVLPAKSLSAAHRDELYEMGIAESLIVRLNLLRGFVVRPLSATRQYTDINQDAIAAGKEQRADYVLAANYQVAGGRIRVTAQLYNVASGQIEETYKPIEQAVGDVFAMQDAVAGVVGQQLQMRFLTTSSSPSEKRGTTNEDAYRFYLQGKNLTAQRSPADAKKAIESFEQAIRLDQNFARAYAGMALAYRAFGTLGGGLPREQFEKAKAAVAKALELDPNLGEAYAARGDLTHKYDWDWAGAEKDLLRAIALEPNNELAHEIYASLLVESGRYDEGMRQLDNAQAINPVSLLLQRERGRYLYFARRYDEAIVQLKRVIEVDENFRTAYGWLWSAYQMKGDDTGAYEWFMKWQKLAKPEDLELLQKAYQTAGWPGVRRKRLEIDKQNEHQPGSNLYAIARYSALLGEKEMAFEYLNKAVEKRHSQLVLLKVEPTFDSLRDDPRFAELLRRVGLK